MVKKLANNSSISCVLNCRIKERNVLATQPFSFPLDIFFIHYNSVIFLTVERISQPQNFSYFLKLVLSMRIQFLFFFLVLSYVFHSYTICFNLIHSPFFLLHFLFCLPSPLFPFNLMCFFFLFFSLTIWFCLVLLVWSWV